MSERLIGELRSSIWRDALDRWFPGCIGNADGFHQQFDSDWTPIPGDERFLVFQARMTWLCATMSSAGIEDPFADYTRRGVAMMDRMAHPRTGAFHWETDDAGRPIGRSARTSHAYGQAFAIYALCAAATALRSEESLDTAKRLFAWIERRQRDGRYGGYFELVTFWGWPLLRSRRLKRHLTGGYKTFNAHIHLFEAFIELYRLWPDPRLRQRIEELIALFTTRWWREPGGIHGRAERNLRPVAGTLSYGHDLELAHLLLAAAELLGRSDDPGLLGKAEALVTTALAESWDAERGGFFDPQSLHRALPEPAKIWWVQAEGLAALAAVHAVTGRPRYRDLMHRQWEWIARHQIDHVNGGWLQTVSADGRPIGDLRKGHEWKEVYHEVRAAIIVARSLGVPAEAVLARPD